MRVTAENFAALYLICYMDLSVRCDELHFVQMSAHALVARTASVVNVVMQLSELSCYLAFYFVYLK